MSMQPWVLHSRNGCSASFAVLMILISLCAQLAAQRPSETDPNGEKLLRRVPRYVDVATFKLDKGGRLQNTVVNISLNQQHRFLTKFGPYIIQLHLYLDKDMESRFSYHRQEMMRAAKEVVNFANTLLRPLNTYLMVTSLHFPSNSLATGHDIPQSNALNFIRDGYTYDNYRVMTEEVIDCVFVFLGRKYVDNTVSESEGDVCKKNLGRPTCVGYVTLEFDRPNYAKIAGFALAHELSHRLGADHDSVAKDCQCRFAQCLMDEFVGTINDNDATVGWSVCSAEKVAKALDSLALDQACLSVKWNSRAYTDGYSITTEYSKDWGSTCGNGILEPGEQCDCGGKLACQSNPCCKGDFCQLADGAECATGDCCNTTTCKPMAKDVLCRLADDPRCDFPEFCDGASSTCPPDVSVKDGWACRASKDHRCHLRHCALKTQAGKYYGPQCRGESVPTTNGDCRPMHRPGPAEIVEIFFDDDIAQGSGDDSGGSQQHGNRSVSGNRTSLEFTDEEAGQLRAIPWVMMASIALLSLSLISHC